jgi:hypothetical protein
MWPKVYSLIFIVVLGLINNPLMAEECQTMHKSAQNIQQTVSMQISKFNTIATKLAGPKKKFRATRKIAGLWDCHPFLYYKSKPQKDREKQIRKQRRKR